MDTTRLVVVLFAILYFTFIIFLGKEGNFEEFAVAGRSQVWFMP